MPNPQDFEREQTAKGGGSWALLELTDALLFQLVYGSIHRFLEEEYHWEAWLLGIYELKCTF